MKTKTNTKTKTSGDIKIGDFVIVATASRSWQVLAGTLASIDGDQLELADAYMIVYYSAGTKSLAGLAVTGAAAGSRISAKVERYRLRGWESIASVTAAARATIEAMPWS